MAHKKTDEPPKTAGQLPVAVASPADVGRLIQELEALDTTLLELELRQPGQDVHLPRTSRLLGQIVELNKLNLLHKNDRQRLLRFLVTVKDRAPVLHMSFSSDPSPAFMEKLVSWLRKEIHTQVLVTVGLQPTIGAGCIVRSTNRYFDFSLRQDFVRKQNILFDALTPKAKEAVTP
ncbi:MAG TPA: hypothetical protein VHB72_01970 [Candidatus Saccharimonadales bacterium]|nr:hypothetical protein [Candidatus Saccharimonadales bacterium]